MRSNSLQKGFSLTEIIVVVAIIALLTAVASVSYGRVKEKAEARAMVEQLVVLETAFRLYRQYELPDGWPTGHIDMRDILSGNSSVFSGFETYYSAGNLGVLDGLDVEYRGISAGNTNCTETNYHKSGVNIRLENDTISEDKLDALFLLMNTMIDGPNDDPDTGCGKIQQGGGSQSVYYNISSSTHSY